MSPKTVAAIKWGFSLVATVCGALAVGNVFPPLNAFLAAASTGLLAWLHAPVPEALEDKVAKAEALVEKQTNK
jgi:hypothetical protein